MEGTAVWGILVGTVKVVVAIVSVPAWFLSAYLLAWFSPGISNWATCDLVHQPFCTRGFGMPQYLTVAVFTGLSSALLPAALFGWQRRQTWFAACLCAVAAGSTVTVLPVLLKPLAPQWWFAI